MADDNSVLSDDNNDEETKSAARHLGFYDNDDDNDVNIDDDDDDIRLLAKSKFSTTTEKNDVASEQSRALQDDWGEEAGISRQQASFLSDSEYAAALQDGLTRRLLRKCCERVRDCEDQVRAANENVLAMLADVSSSAALAASTGSSASSAVAASTISQDDFVRLASENDDLRLQLVRKTDELASLRAIVDILPSGTTTVAGAVGKGKSKFKSLLDDDDIDDDIDDGRRAALDRQESFSDISALLDDMNTKMSIKSEVNAGDLELLIAFLSELKQLKEEERSSAVRALGLVDGDLVRAQEQLTVMRKSRQESTGGAAAANPFGGSIFDALPPTPPQLDKDETERMRRKFERLSAPSTDSRKRRTSGDSGDDDDSTLGDDDDDDVQTNAVSQAKRRRRMELCAPLLQRSYFQSRGLTLPSSSSLSSSSSSPATLVDDQAQLSQFTGTLSQVTRYDTIHPMAVWQFHRRRDSGVSYDAQCHVTSVSFDREGTHFSVAGGSYGHVQLYEFETTASSNDVTPQCTMIVGEQVNSAEFDPHFKHRMAMATTSGAVQLWDIEANGLVLRLTGHRKRVWDLQFSPAQPELMASCGDDCTVRLWYPKSSSRPTAAMTCEREIASVRFNPANENEITFACADGNLYYYDIRHTARPAYVLEAHGPRAATSVRYLSRHELISQGNDERLALWQLPAKGGSAFAAATAGTAVTLRPKSVYSGHRSANYFVGLDVNQNKLLATGSEDNSVYVYHAQLPTPMLEHSFNLQVSREDTGAVITDVAWRQNSNVLLAANNKGIVKLLGLRTVKWKS
jgi:WD40 repeat protein